MAERVRVASFNIRTSNGRDRLNGWRLRRSICLATIRGFDADVIGLQEVRPDQLADLRAAFPAAQIVGAGRDTDGGGEHASVLIRTDRWSVESAQTRWLSESPDRPGSTGWDGARPRVVTLVRLRCGDTRLGVANTHFDHEGVLARERSAELLARWLTAEHDRPWVVLGDLNDEPWTVPVQTLTAAGFADAVLPLDLPPQVSGTEHAFSGATDRNRIDYVLTGPGVRVEAAWIGHERPRRRLPSDHWPVLADLVIE